MFRPRWKKRFPNFERNERKKRKGRIRKNDEIIYEMIAGEE